MLTAEQLKQQGNQLAGQKNYSAALEKYNQSVQADSQLAAAWLNKGLMHKMLNQHDDAIDAFDHALNINPDYLKARNNKADIFYHQGKYQEARQLFYEVLQAHPNNYDALKGKVKCESHVAPRIIFGIIDLKLTSDGQVKILEFGEGMRSSFDGLTLSSQVEILELLISKAKALKLPPLIFSRYPGSVPSSQYNLSVEQIMQLCDKTNGASNKVELPQKLSDIDAIYGGALIGKPSERVLSLTDVNASLVMNDKCLTFQMFQLSELYDCIPRTVSLRGSSIKDINATIVKALPDVTQYVFKLPQVNRGEGVIVVPSSCLEAYLQFLFGRESREDRLQKFGHFLSDINQYERSDFVERVKLLENWQACSTGEFLVQEYIENKEILKDGVPYDATMRTAFLFVRDGDKLQCELFGPHWKLPPKGKNKLGSSRASQISSYTKNHTSAVLVSDEDRAIVNKQLERILPHFFQTVLTSKLVDNFDRKTLDPSEETKSRLMHGNCLGNAVVWAGYELLEQYYIDQLRKIAPNYPPVSIIQAHHDWRAGEFSKAIKCVESLPNEFVKRSANVVEVLAYCYIEMSRFRKERWLILSLLRDHPLSASTVKGYEESYMAAQSPETFIQRFQEMNRGSSIDFSVLGQNLKRMKR